MNSVARHNKLKTLTTLVVFEFVVHYNRFPLLQPLPILHPVIWKARLHMLQKTKAFTRYNRQFDHPNGNISL